MSAAKTVGIVLAILFGIGLLMVIACGGLLYWGYQTATSSVNPEIEALFGSLGTPAFADTYDSLLSREFRASTTKEKYVRLGDKIFVNLGKLQSKSMTAFNMQQNNAHSSIDVTYDAEFESDSGTIQATLVKEGQAWKFQSFRINSPALAGIDFESDTCPNCGSDIPEGARFCPECGNELPSDDDNAVKPEVEDGSLFDE